MTGATSAATAVALMAGLAACFTPDYPTALRCSDGNTCPPGQGCDEVANTCTPECVDGACEIALAARTVRFDQLDRGARADVTLRVTSVPTEDQVPEVSDQDGSIHLDDLAAFTALELLLIFPQTDPVVGDQRLATQYLGGNIDGPLALELPVVEYRWLAKVAHECGLFDSLDDALYQPGTPNVNNYFFTRSTVIGEVFEENGDPATLERGEIEVSFDGHVNFHGNAKDVDDEPAYVCFLEPDAASGTYVGVPAATSSSGRFVMFRATDALGLGRGWVEVRVTGYPKGVVNLRSVGNIGVVRMQKGVEPPPPPPAVSFETDVYPMLTQLGCRACHAPGESGYEIAEIRGDAPADFSGSPREVFDVLMAGSEVNCAATATPARICTSAPEQSLFYTKPRLETGAEASDHLGIAFPQDSNVLTFLLDWVQRGAEF